MWKYKSEQTSSATNEPTELSVSTRQNVAPKHIAEPMS